MRQERTIQATIFEVFAQHEIGCELKAMSQWLDGQRQLTSLVAGDLRRQGVRETGRRGLWGRPTQRYPGGLIRPLGGRHSRYA
jgi:IS5 family transposase